MHVRFTSSPQLKKQSHAFQMHFVDLLSFSPALTGSKTRGADVASPSSFTAFTDIRMSEKRTNPERGMLYRWTPGGGS